MFCNTDQYVSKTTYEMYMYVNWPEMLAKWPRSLINWWLAKWLLGKTTTNTNAIDRYTTMNSRKSACPVENNGMKRIQQTKEISKEMFLQPFWLWRTWFYDLSQVACSIYLLFVWMTGIVGKQNSWWAKITPELCHLAKVCSHLRWTNQRA